MAEATYNFGESPVPVTSVYSGLFKEGVIPVDGTYLIGRPDVRENIFPGLKEEDYLTQFLWDTGRRKITDQSTFWWFEDKDLIPKAQIASVTGSNAPGAHVHITMEARADLEVPFKKWDTLIVGGIRGWIELDGDITKNSGGAGEHAFRIQPVDSSDNIVAAAVEGDWVIWYGNAKADGTAQPGSMISMPVKYSGNTQILSTTFISHGSAAADRTVLKLSRKTGKTYGYVRGLDQAYTRHMIAIAHTILVGQKAVGLADTTHEDGSMSVRMFDGFEKSIENYGHNFVGTEFSFDTLQQMNLILDAENAPNEYLGVAGNKFRQAVTSTFLNAGVKSSDVTLRPFEHTRFTTWGAADPKQRMIDLGLDGVKVDNRSFYFKTEPTMYYKNTLGAPGLPYPEKCFFVPFTQFMDAKSGELEDVFCLRYKASDLEDRFMQENFIDWKKSDNGVDKFKWFHRSEVGVQFAKRHWAAQYSPDDSGSV
jgi:hypothetical protein